MTVRFSTMLLISGLFLFPYPIDWLPELALLFGMDGFLVGGVLIFILPGIILLSFLSASGLLLYSLIRRRPYCQYAIEAVVSIGLLLFLPTQ